MAERVDLDAAERTAARFHADGFVNPTILALVAELRVAREVTAVATLVERHKPMHRWACTICKLHGAVDAYHVAMTPAPDQATAP